MKLKNIFLTIFAATVATVVLFNSNAVFTAAAAAVKNCLTNVVPSLMTFMTIACFISESACGDVISRIVGAPVRLLFHLPENCAKTVVLSMLGGYPCGAKMISDMLKRGETDINTAQKMLAFCINASPAYVITAIGIGLFESAKIGTIIWTSHILTAILIGFLFREKNLRPTKISSPARPKAAQSFVKAVFDSTSSMLYISGFVVTFSVILALLNTTGLTEMLGNALTTVTGDENTSRSLIYILFDVVTGSASCTQCPPLTAVTLCAAAVSLGGMSVWFQVAYILSEYKIKLSKVVAFRLLHSVLTAAVTYIIIKITDTHIQTAYVYGSSLKTTANGVAAAALFLLSCVFFVITVDKNISLIKQRCRK